LRCVAGQQSNHGRLTTTEERRLPCAMDVWHSIFKDTGVVEAKKSGAERLHER
jgi:hypothetical protein